jgi:murein L,D-transpeptidase YcbB/YkuD
MKKLKDFVWLFHCRRRLAAHYAGSWKKLLSSKIEPIEQVRRSTSVERIESQNYRSSRKLRHPIVEVQTMKFFLAYIVAVLCLVSILFQPAIAETDSFKSQVSALLGSKDSHILAKLSGKTVYATQFIYQMYQCRGFKLIWNDDGIASLSTALESLKEDGLTADDYRFAEFDSQLRAANRTSLGPGRMVEMDILLTEAFLRAVYNLYFGRADPERIDANINFTRSHPGEGPIPRLLRYITQARIDDAFDWARPKNKRYQWLKTGLARYREYQAAGGWDPIPAGEILKPGITHPRVAMLRTRLAVTGDLPAGVTVTDDSELFDEILKSAVERFQTRHGLEADGVVGAETLAAMNVPVKERIDQIRVNLERGRWILHEAYADYLVADIAGFNIFWAKDEDVFWQEQIQVGKEYTKTPVFKGEIRYLDFNPTWTIPPGILRSSVIPGLKKDPDYLNKKGYQLLTRDGKPVDPKTVNWKALKGFPYIVRQPPGPDNALGQIKFMFPNPHFVFLHDTNHREFFARTKRTFSSGCIRVRNPFDLAERLLAEQDDWTRARIDEVVASGKTKRVILRRPVRIFIAYNTARVPAAGSQVVFRPDIYKRDARVLAALNSPFRLHQRDKRNHRPTVP